MPSTIFSGSKVKALKKIFSLNDGAEIHSGTTDPTSSAVSAPVGSLYMHETTGAQYRKLDSGSSTNWSLVGSGGDNLNYAQDNNSTFDTALGTGWSTYADGNATPSDTAGNSGGATLAISHNTASSPLNGNGSMRITPGTLGDGAKFTFPKLIQPRDWASVFEANLMYRINTYANFTDGDFTVWFISASDSGFTTNIQKTQLAPYKILKASGSEQFKGIFQTHASNTYGRILIHQAQTPAGAYTIDTDDFYVGPQQQEIYDYTFGSTPVGGIMAWSGGYFGNSSNGSFTNVLGNTVSDANTYLATFGFKVCDGTAPNDSGSIIFNTSGKYLPNLTDSRFLMGSTSFGSVGGENANSHTHSIPTHYHNSFSLTAAGQTHSGNSPSHNAASTAFLGAAGLASGANFAPQAATISISHTHASSSVSGTIGNQGGVSGDSSMTSGSPSDTENRPLYLSTFYIIRIK